jgi:hypothetical protein
MEEGGSTGASDAWRAAMARDREPEEQGGRPGDRRPSLQPDDWVRVDEIEDEATDAVARGRRPARHAPARDRDAGSPVTGVDESEVVKGSVREELLRAVGSTRVARYEQRLKDATRAFNAERYADALRILRKLAEDAPSAAAVRELHGLTLYRLGRWRPAIRELEAFRTLTSSTEQHPVLADCYRAIRQYDQVEALWDELRQESPSAELVTEGRIVLAGAKADQGDVAGALHTLEQGFSFPKRPKEHQLRRAYALADAFERSGDVVRARELFERVASHDREFADVVRRAHALR